MPTARKFHAASVVGDKIYVIAGRHDNLPTRAENLLTEYDPANDTWTTKTSIPTSRMAFSTSAVNGKIYAIGGGREVAGHRILGISSVEEYDPSTDTWEEKMNMPTPRLGLGTCVVDGKIYAIGGMAPDSVFWSGLHDIVEAYDPVSDTWTIETDIPELRAGLSANVVNGKIYTIGGVPKLARVYQEGEKSVFEYNPTMGITDKVAK